MLEASNDSIIIPETQCDFDISDDDGEISVQRFQNERDVSKIDFNTSTSTVKSTKTSDNVQPQMGIDSDGSDDTDYIRIASDSTQSQALQSQAILANADLGNLNNLSSANDDGNTTPPYIDQPIRVEEVLPISNAANVQKLVAERSSSVTPDLDLADITAENEQTANVSLDDSDFFDACTQQTVVKVSPKQIEGTAAVADENSYEARKEEHANKSAQEKNPDDGNDVYEAQTQMLNTTIEAQSDFAVPLVPKVKTPKQSRQLPIRAKNATNVSANESNDDIFDVATQQMPAYDDIFAVATQAIATDDAFEQPTQVLPSTSSAKPSKADATKKAVSFSATLNPSGKVRLGT